jgi:hypothetical protein
MKDRTAGFTRVGETFSRPLSDMTPEERERRTYDQIQRGAVLISWLCCHRTVYATHPKEGCCSCR